MNSTASSAGDVPTDAVGPTHTASSPLKLVLFALIPVTVLAVLAEILAAVTIERATQIETDPSSGARSYVMRMGSWPWSRIVSTRLNALGFPGPELPDSTEEKRCMHVVFIGDSFVFGDGVEGDSSFVSLIGRTLASRSGSRCVRFFNLGERGSTIPRQRRRLLEVRSRIRPDLVILSQYQNDLADLDAPEPRDLRLVAPVSETSSGHGTPTEATAAVDRFSLLSPRLVRFLSYHAFAALITSGIHRDELSHWSVLADTARRADAARLMTAYTASFDSLAAELAADSVAFGTIILPSKFDVMAGRFPEEAFFLGLAAKNRVPTLRIFPVLDAQRAPYAFLMYDGHLNEHGNRIVATAVNDWLLSASPAPFPRLRTTMVAHQ